MTRTKKLKYEESKEGKKWEGKRWEGEEKLRGEKPKRPRAGAGKRRPEVGGQLRKVKPFGRRRPLKGARFIFGRVIAGRRGNQTAAGEKGKGKGKGGRLRVRRAERLRRDEAVGGAQGAKRKPEKLGSGKAESAPSTLPSQKPKAKKTGWKSELPKVQKSEDCGLKTAHCRALRASCRLWSAGRRTKAGAPVRAGDSVFRWFSVQLPCGT